MRISTSMRWLVVALSAAMLLAVVAACAGETVEVPGETVVVKEEVVKTVEVPGETVVVEKEVIKTVEVPGETVTKEVIKEVMVPGETVVVKEEVIKTVEVPGQTVVKEVVKEVEVPGETVVVKEEVVKTVEVPGETVVVEKVVVKEVPAGYVTDPTNGKVYTAPTYGGTITEGWKGESVDVDNYFSFGPQDVVTGVLDKLAMVDWAIDRDEFSLRTYSMPLSVMTGMVAESWAMPDDTTIVFNIRQDVRWHNKAPMNGRELDAKDIEYNYQRTLGLGSGFTEKSPTSGRFGTIPWESVTATDKNTVVFKLKEPHMWGLWEILWHQTGNWIYPPEVIKEHGDAKDWKNLVGTGPYELTGLLEGSSVTWEKNPDYWGFDEKYPANRLPYTDGVRALIMPDEATRIAALRTGKLDRITIRAGSHINSVDTSDSLQKTNPEIVQLSFRFRSNNGFQINVTQPPLDDVNVRKALQMALDLELINDLLYKGRGYWEPKGMTNVPGWSIPFEDWPEEVKKGYVYDPAGAEALLDEAGLTRGSDGIRFEAWIPVGVWTDTDYIELVAAQWLEIGVDLELRAFAGAEFFPMMIEREYSFINSEPANSSGRSHLVTRFHSLYATDKSEAMYPYSSGTNDPDYDLLIDVFNAAASLDEYGRLLGEADMYLIRNHWITWGVEQPNIQAAQPWVKGWDGEINVGRHQYGALNARLWVDLEMKAAMGY